MTSNTEGSPWRLKPGGPEGKYTNQLQFNLKATPRAFNLETHFQKPEPIVIEKLQPTKSSSDRQSIPISLTRSSSSLSSDRLELAVQLAKRDVKKLKNMLAEPQINMPGILGQNSDGNKAVKKDVINDKKVIDNQKRTKYSVVTEQRSKEIRNQERKPTFGKLMKVTGPRERRNSKNTQMQFYPSEGDVFDDEENTKSPAPKTREMSEIKRLRRELQKYMKRLDSVLEQKDMESKEADLIKRKTHFEEDTEYERKEHRAEEQAARSARVLYMLQRKIQEIQDELEEKGYHIKHTKKSQSLTRLAAAHRAAVRALQMFVNQAPLYYDLKHGLPPMYSELAMLIQQLSLLSSHFDAEKDLPDFDLDMLPRTKKLISSWNQKSKPQQRRAETNKSYKRPVLQKKSQPVERRGFFPDENKEWAKERMNSIIQRGQKELDISSKTNGPTPEREAALQAGLDALERAKLSASFASQGVGKKKGGLRVNLPVRTGKARAKSVLIPHFIKKNRQSSSLGANRARRPMSSRRAEGQEMGFAKQTVSSTLKQQPEIVYEPRRVKARSPNRNEIPEGVHLTYGTPKQRDKEILKIASPRSPRTRTMSNEKESPTVRFLDFDEKEPSVAGIGISEREAARQAWLDRERDREIRRLSDLRRKDEDHHKDISNKYIKAHDIINDAEKKIKSQLQPLLDKAELMAEQEKLREDQYKGSVRRKLADIVTGTAMSRGELLADMILDDILTETVYELQRIEDEEEAEAKAIFERDKPTLESIEQRLAMFEEEEQQIRRRWKKLHYSELDIKNEDPTDPQAAKQKPRSGAKPIIFTSAGTTREAPNMTIKQYHPKDQTAIEASATPHDGKGQFYVPDAMKASILSYQRQYEKYLKRTIMEEHGTFNPWGIIEKISDEICDELISEVQKEVDNLCDEYVEEVYKEEFLKNDSTMTEVSVSDRTL